MNFADCVGIFLCPSVMKTTPKAKTLLEWLNTLPRGHKERAILRWQENSTTPADEIVEYLGDALDYAFTWSRTPEGKDYWMHLADWAYSPETNPLPKLPRLKHEHQ